MGHLLGMDHLEFRSPVVVYTRPNGLEVPLYFTPTWQRRLKAIWDFLEVLNDRATSQALYAEGVGGGGIASLDDAFFLVGGEARPNPDASDLAMLLAGAAPAAPFQPPIRDTRANRANYPAASYVNVFYVETDTTSDLVYQSDGTNWIYVAGIYRDVLANILTGLTASDDGLLYEVTDYDHVLQRIGNAWTWGPGEIGNGYVQSFGRAPNSVGANSWQVCDGSTVAVLNADGTTTNVTVPNYSTAAYLKLISAAATIGPTAASGTTANTTPTNNAAATGITVDAHAVVEKLDVAGVGIFVFDASADAAHVVNDPTHNHTQNAHNHAPGTLELRNTELLAYYRR